MNGILSKLRTTLAMIKFEHTLFALAVRLSRRDFSRQTVCPTWRQILWITVAMVGARSAAMTFNRSSTAISTPQTREQPIANCPSGKLSVGFAWAFLYASIGVFLLASYSLNWLTFALSPVALIFVLGYSYAKRSRPSPIFCSAWPRDLAFSGMDRGPRQT